VWGQRVLVVVQRLARRRKQYGQLLVGEVDRGHPVLILAIPDPDITTMCHPVVKEVIREASQNNK
jgi:hypothetical protein